MDLHKIISTLLLGVGMCLCMNIIGGGSVLMIVIGVVVLSAFLIGLSVNDDILSLVLIYRNKLESESKRRFTSW